MRIRYSSIVVVALMATACASPGTTSPSSAATSVPTTAPTMDPTTAPTPSPAASASAASPLEGSWSTGTLTCDQQNAALTKAGFTEAELTLVGWDVGGCGGMMHGSQFTARFAEGRLIHFNDGSVGWDGVYELTTPGTFIAGDLGPEAGLYITYTYVLDGDLLTIDMIDNQMPASNEAERLGELVAQTVIYESAPFVRDGTGTAFTSTLYPYTVRLPEGWTATTPGVDEDFFEGPGAMTLKVGTATPEPGQTVADRVAANRADQFRGCDMDPALDTASTMGGEAAIRWSASCGSLLSLATNTIHDGLGYRLLVTLPAGADAMTTATAVMDELIATFSFTD